MPSYVIVKSLGINKSLFWNKSYTVFLSDDKEEAIEGYDKQKNLTNFQRDQMQLYIRIIGKMYRKCFAFGGNEFQSIECREIGC